ncbi:MAG: SDR family NAD(P)-dependent oxidoreductase [Alcanivoracaceae bacterium]|nr:SDR family NAD(P)-dependent oxidoreductase [Alcanivoracaceae bacterium]
MIRDKKILITGGSSGLGLALAKRLAANHNQLALVARDAKKLQQAEDAIRAEIPGAKVKGYSIDVSDPASADALNAAAVEMGGLDMLINSAGILREGYFQALSDKDFRDTLEINFFGTVNTIRALLPQLKQQRGRIVNIASIAGLTGVFGYAAYCSSKFALIGLTESLNFELKPQGVQVQVACPPEFDSPMVDALDKSRTPENRAHTLTIPKLTIEQCVDGVLKGMNSNRLIIIPGAQSKFLAFGIRHFPSISRLIGANKIRAASNA